MGFLTGLREYLEAHYEQSHFGEIRHSGEPHFFRIHEVGGVTGEVMEDRTYEVLVRKDSGEEETIHKTSIQYFFPAEHREKIQKLVKKDSKVEALGLEPIIPARPRHHIKNKTLFPLMDEKTVVFFTMLEGDVLRGIISGFNRYEILLLLKGGLPVTLLRHAVYDLRDKKGRCYLKSTQETLRDWHKSALYVSE